LLQGARLAVEEAGIPPAGIGYRWVEGVSVEEAGADVERTVIHPREESRNPLPENAALDDLPAERGWWGFSFRDVPCRISGETVLVTLADGRVVPYVDPETGEFHVCVLTPDDRFLDVREMAFRPEGHPAVLRTMRPRRLERATWILERVYHNHSHWLTAHLPKVIMARERGWLPRTILPGAKTTRTIEESLDLLDVGSHDTPRLDPVEPLRVEELEVLVTDRFRPELLRCVRQAFGRLIEGTCNRRIYISRAKASRRRLVNEERIWPLLRRVGFERVFMEDLSLAQQVRLMGQAEVVVGPHGAGLTNIVFCPEGTKVVEIADLSFPNPNLYATAAAMGHRYWILSAETRGEGHPLERDMWIDPEQLEGTLAEL
jgi:hypothetical protein